MITAMEKVEKLMREISEHNAAAQAARLELREILDASVTDEKLLIREVYLRVYEAQAAHMEKQKVKTG